MKKSKVITLGILATAISSCSEQPVRRSTGEDWNVPNSYVSTDSGTTYHHSHSGTPIWFYMWMINNNGRYSYCPTVGYRGGMRNHSSWRVSSMGHSYSHSSSSSHSFSRGGFGSSGHFSSAS